MNNTEYMLNMMQEECAEIQQSISKALRFGINNHHPDKCTTNAVDILDEYYQLQAVTESLIESGILPKLNNDEINSIKSDKMKAINKWKKVSIKNECLTY